MCNSFPLCQPKLILLSEALQKTWRSPIYSFFKPNVTFQIHDDRPCHFFACAAPKCKAPAGGVRRFQDSKDKASTANLKHHALRCFGEDAVNAAIARKKAPSLSGSIFALFARKGKQPVKYSHRAHTNPEVRLVYFNILFQLCMPVLTALIVRASSNGLQKTTAL